MSKNRAMMSEEKKADRKSKIIFAATMLGCFSLGALGGFLSNMFADSNVALHSFAEMITDVMNRNSYHIGALVSGIAAVIGLIFYRQAHKGYEVWDEEDDEAMDTIEEKLSLALIVTNAALIFTYVSTSIGIGQMSTFFAEGEFAIIKSVILLGGFFFSLIVAWFLNAKVVSFEKMLNPEKKGNLYDFNFQKKWMDSSDEAEKLITYKCGFAAYKVVNAVCSVLIVVCMFGMIIWQWDNIPVLMVGVIWLASYLGYSVEAVKLSKHESGILE